MDEPVGAIYDGEITLLGYTTPSQVTQVPGFLHLTLFWQAERRRPDELVITVAVVDETGDVVAMASGAPAMGRYPTSDWSRGEIVRDAYAFWFGGDFVPGSYTVGIAVHRGDQPITPEGMENPFLRLYDMEVQQWEE